MTSPFRGMDLKRRTFLAMLGASGAAAALRPTWSDLPADAAPTPIDPAYPLGVAAGDPLPDGAVIWTQVDPEADAGSGVEVAWEVSATDDFATILASGTVTALAENAHCVHARVAGLPADGWFHYRFRYGSATSRTGRLRTAPAPGSSPERLRFTFCSCQQTTASFYVAHRAMAAEDLDFVVHYGDYIYVSDGGTITLDDYRAVWRRFKSNPLLQDLHATYPMVMMWDDGEFVNGVDKTMPEPRFTNAKKAWFEFAPHLDPTDGGFQVHRRLQWGDLVDFPLLDVRSKRDVLIDANVPDGLLPTTDTALPSGAAIFDPDRSSLGAEQFAWLEDILTSSTATWKHIGTGYPFVALRLEDYDTPAVRADPPEGWHPNGGKYFSTEQWDGYWAERRAIMDLIADECVENVIITSGHTHIWFECGIRPDYDDLPGEEGHVGPGSPIVAREYVCGSLTADPDVRDQFFPGQPKEEQEAGVHALEAAFLGANPHVDYIDLLYQGYGLVTFTPTRATVDFRIIDTFDADAVATTKESYAVAVGELPEGICANAPVDETTTTTAPAVDPGGRDAPPATPIGGSPTYTG
ncbi:MAG: alkaline phosphatase D family protein [Acidimicrobiales bacterium]|nr:alkaline phosphatase D family protein [Acidimicrobiales bacterium]HRW39271.1 alkaline phosphatase D family protein [Aquihabitans sp.]